MVLSELKRIPEGAFNVELDHFQKEKPPLAPREERERDTQIRQLSHSFAAVSTEINRRTVKSVYGSYGAKNTPMGELLARRNDLIDQFIERDLDLPELHVAPTAQMHMENLRDGSVAISYQSQLEEGVVENLTQR